MSYAEFQGQSPVPPRRSFSHGLKAVLPGLKVRGFHPDGSEPAGVTA
jgi:hypothetical protein